MCCVHARCALFVFLTSILLAGCGTLPPLEQSPAASTDQIVTRVKCELAKAMSPYLAKKDLAKKTKHEWLQKWTADVDLTLIVSDQSGLAVGMQINEPLQSAVIKGIGSFQQAFTFGFGAGVNSTATRTEQLSFGVGLKDIEKESARPVCWNLPEDRDLNANLGMQEWIASVFSPIDGELLSQTTSPPGNPKRLKISQPTTRMIASLAAEQRTFSREYSNQLRTINKIEDPLEDLENAMRGRLKYTPPVPPKHADVFKAFNIYHKELADPIPREKQEDAADDAAAENDVKEWLRLTKALEKALIAVHADALAKAKKSSEMRERESRDEKRKREESEDPLRLLGLDPDVPSYERRVGDKATTVEKAFELYSAVINAITGSLPKAPKPKPPIEVISHQVNFVVAASGSASPNWNLVRFRGPTTGAPTMLSGTRTRTHGLVITIGPPASEAAKNSRSAASISSALKASGIVLPP